MNRCQLENAQYYVVILKLPSFIPRPYYAHLHLKTSGQSNRTKAAPNDPTCGIRCMHCRLRHVTDRHCEHPEE